MKKFLSYVISAVMLLSVFSGLTVTASAAAPYVTHTAPKSLKIGQALPPIEVTYHNLPANTKLSYAVMMRYCLDHPFHDGEAGFCRDYFPGGYGDAAEYVMTDEKGQYHVQYNPLHPDDEHFIAARAGTTQFQPKYQLYDEANYPDNKNPIVNVGNPIKLTIEEPVITHNAPKSVKIGQSITFTTALTNTALTSVPISKYTSLNNTKYQWQTICPVYYVPVITVIQGKELIKQSGQDYSQTQKSSETITFNKAGTVQLKITYKKYILDCKYNNGPDTYCITEDGSKNPEKIVTVNVTDPNAPVTTAKPTEKPTVPNGNTSKPNEQPTNSSEIVTSTSPSSHDESQTAPEQPPVIIEDDGTGVKITAPKDLLPDGTELKAAVISAGEQFNKVMDTLKEIAKKAIIFDLSLEKDGSKVAFNGKVTVSLPIPDGYEKSRLAVFYISDDGEKSEIPCTVNGDILTFETDHFSTYALAEKTEEAAAADNTPSAVQTPVAPAQVKSNTALYIGLAVGAALLLAGAGVAVWYFNFRKKHGKIK